MNEQSLEFLLSEVQLLFGPRKEPYYQFHLGRIAGVWRFEVVDSWKKWLSAGYRLSFDGPTPQAAICDFLAHVATQAIDVQALTEKGPVEVCQNNIRRAKTGR